MLYLNQVTQGNSVELMKQIDDNTIDLTITSPPYDSLRSYNGKINKEVKFDEHFSFPFIDMATELYRITKDGGLVVWVVGDSVVNGGESGNSFRQVLKFQEIGFKIYDTMIYQKNGAAYHEVSRYDQIFEYMFVLLKGDRPKTVNIIKDKKNRWGGSKTFGTPSTRQKDGSIKKMKEGFTVSEYGSRYNIWYIVNGKGFGGDKLSYSHPASFPESLAEDHVLSWSKPGDIVFDPMIGSGTTAKMAKMNGRNYIGFDIIEEYVKIAQTRLDSVKPYTEENPNPKSKFIVSREETLAKRKKSKS
jgi:site-specific DNA-methyltransferase (adenine-specific)